MKEEVQIAPDELAHLLELVTQANFVGSSAAAMSAERLRKCVEVGSILNRWKESIPRGQWQSWLDQHLPEDLNERTRRRWMQLAQLDASNRLDLETARGLRHAYQLAQLLPEGDSTGTKQTTTKATYLVHLARLSAAITAIDITKLSGAEKAELKERLQPILKVLERL